MKRNFSLLSALLLSLFSYSQLNIQGGAIFTIQSGAVVTVQGDVTSGADIQGTGLLLLKGSTLQNINMNGLTIPNLEIDNANNINLTGGLLVGSSLLFTNGKILLNTHNLTVAAAASLTGFGNTKYIITNGTGRLVKNSLGAAFTFPVGFDATTYNPLALTQSGTVDNIGVRVLSNVLSNGNSGAPFVKEVVDASWDVAETTPGGSVLSMTAGWNTSDQLPGFSTAKTGISYYDGVGWDLTNAQTGAASGGGPWSITRNSVSNLGVFAVGTRPVLISLLVAPKIYLQGAYLNTGTPGLMRDNLRAAGLVLPSEPYTGTSNFTHSGSGGGEVVFSPTLAGTGTGTDVVDWVFAQLHQASNGAVIATRAVLLQRNGFVVDEDPTSNTGGRLAHINFAGVVDDPANFYVSLRHRNQ